MENEPKNYCTGTPDWAIEGTNISEKCCKPHDQHYVEQIITQSEADAIFFNCLIEEAAPEWFLVLALIFVPIIGRLFWWRRERKNAK